MVLHAHQSNDPFECRFLRDPFDERWFDQFVIL